MADNDAVLDIVDTSLHRAKMTKAQVTSSEHLSLTTERNNRWYLLSFLTLRSWHPMIRRRTSHRNYLVRHRNSSARAKHSPFNYSALAKSTKNGTSLYSTSLTDANRCSFSSSCDFLQKAFDMFPDRDYCVITIPQLVPEFPLLQSFLVSSTACLTFSARDR